MTTVGFIGLGTMGTAMAKRLLGAGHTVVVWNRSREAVQELVEAGATAAESPGDALATGIAFSMLANDAAAVSVFTNETLARASGALHVNMATVSLDAARTLADAHARADVHYVAAPVLGRPSVAEAGQLNIVAAGAAADLDAADEFLRILGKAVWRVGDEPEKANLVKIGVNYNLIHALQALAESINLMEGGGVDGATFVDILTDAAFTGSAYKGYGPLIADRRYTPTAFGVDLGLKDLRLAQAAGRRFGAALPTSGLLEQIFEETLGDPALAQLDWSAMAEITRRRNVAPESTPAADA